MSYNGWTNYETWNVNLWIGNEYPGIDEDIQQYANECRDNVGKLSDYIEAQIDELNPIADQANLFTDLLGTALREVNWYEIAEHYIADLDPIEPDEDEISFYDPHFHNIEVANGNYLCAADFDYDWCSDTNVYEQYTADRHMIYEPLTEIDLSMNYPTLDVFSSIARYLNRFGVPTIAEVNAILDPAAAFIMSRK